MTLYAIDGVAPTLPEDGNFWIAPSAVLIGNVIIGSGVSIWFGAVLRGDNEPISIGDGSNVQEGCVLHTDMGFPLAIGKNCTIGHKAMLHGCQIADGSLIGMCASVLNGASVGMNAVVGANALVAERKSVDPGTLVVGTPARMVRVLSESEIAEHQKAAKHYRDNVARYRSGLVELHDSGGN